MYYSIIVHIPHLISLNVTIRKHILGASQPLSDGYPRLQGESILEAQKGLTPPTKCQPFFARWKARLGLG